MTGSRKKLDIHLLNPTLQEDLIPYSLRQEECAAEQLRDQLLVWAVSGRALIGWISRGPYLILTAAD
ncbi:hypothetical protein [Holdemania massiliensis]|uniref:Uncharacterized protein n=1 Tax=Holdemania massiliensis TaxID=1468449 RepID=A0A6N7S652_9FIRM|nr:hypothetical protein [Holdemania massiliensis]MSA71035.1 hypothetical protein [Holdemania massiliensis]MSA89361.1 hypothetical protein [Holdemania massiliensis]MSB78114.1 hypothetical protein [Holdemania massiliensis]MSC33039.1 hypothetical protein [Holdemania massiliensis]MSC39651.1 hypothetical protein [Holdemania massiliensis]